MILVKLKVIEHRFYLLIYYLDNITHFDLKILLDKINVNLSMKMIAQ